ncbi:MAG: hypothetical protein ACKVS8_03520 [Phycisphaerales bacterium]
MIRSAPSIAACLLASACVAASASGALVVPFTETFATDAARWSDRSAFRELSFLASGGPDGSAYASGNNTFTANAAGDFAVVSRGQGNFNSSNSNFVGNWITGAVSTFSIDLRQQTGAPLQMFLRFVTAANFPGAAYTIPFLIPHNTWTNVVISIDAFNPGFTYESFRNPMDPNFQTLAFGDAFSALSRVQVAVAVPATLAGTTTSVVFDIDNVRIVPGPGAAALIGMVGVVATRRRRA